MEQRSREQGFTIVELMVVVAIIAVLAAVVIPSFMTQSKKVKATSEVGAMFGELATREDQYKLENGTYLEAAACPTGTPSNTPRDFLPCLAAATPWDALRVRPPSSSKTNTTNPVTVYCTYEITTNASATTTAPSWADFTAPPTSWFFVVATCDMDSDGNTSMYFTSSANSALQTHNDGN